MARRLYRVALTGPAGRLEAVHTLPAAPPRGAALVCHPHPQYGGTMHTKTVYRTARALLDAGYEVLRFNFRGVGHSAGSFHGGHGELDDARAALSWLRQRAASRRTLLAGFSFGSYVALRVAGELHDIHGRIAIGVPLELYDFDFLRPAGAPLLLVAGADDPFCTPEALTQLGKRLGPAARVRILPGAGHLLLEAQVELHDAVEAFARALLDDVPA
jgi:alpha/beta superfamily hydrolase